LAHLLIKFKTAKGFLENNTHIKFLQSKAQMTPIYAEGPGSQLHFNFITVIGVRGGGWGGGRPPVLKIFRANSVFSASAICSKILNDKNISIQWKISGQVVFFRASESCSKIL